MDRSRSAWYFSGTYGIGWSIHFSDGKLLLIPLHMQFLVNSITPDCAEISGSKISVGAVFKYTTAGKVVMGQEGVCDPELRQRVKMEWNSLKAKRSQKAGPFDAQCPKSWNWLYVFHSQSTFKIRSWEFALGFFLLKSIWMRNDQRNVKYASQIVGRYKPVPSRKGSQWNLRTTERKKMCGIWGEKWKSRQTQMLNYHHLWNRL